MKHKRFEIDLNYADAGLFIRHSAFPECVIEVIELESQSMWSEVAGYGSIFDLFTFSNENKLQLYMLMIDQYIDHDDADDVPEDEVHTYRRIIKSCWKWLLYAYLLPGNELTAAHRYIALNRYDADDVKNKFTLEITDAGIFITHRIYPVFIATVKGNKITVSEILENAAPDAQLLAAIMREMGDWYAQLR